MKLKLTLIVTAMIVITALSVFAWNNILTCKPPPNERPMPVHKEEADAADLLMLHPRTLPSPRSDGFQLMGSNEFVQVNYDGFGGDQDDRRHRCQTFAIQQFTRSVGNETKTELYVGVEAGASNRSQVWRSDYPPAPESWFQVAKDGFGDQYNQHIDSAAVFKDKFDQTKLYMGVCNEETGCQVWCTDGSEDTGNEPYLKWTKVAQNGFDSDNGNAYCMAVFKGYVYVGTFNTNTGCEVWRSNNPATSTGSWEPVNYGGFGSADDNEPDNICVMDMIVFNGQLYAGTWNTDHTQSTVGRIFRYTENGKDWTEVWDGNVGGNWYAIAARCFAEFENELYVGIFHDAGSGDDIFKYEGGSTWTGVCIIDGTNESDVIDLINFYDMNGEDPPASFLYATTGQGDLDLVWRSSNVTDWVERSENGFGDDNNDSLFCFGTFGKRHDFNALYVGTWNDSDDTGTGTEIWQTPMTETDCTYITLESFEAVARKDGSILLHWVTGTEIGTAGFDLYRSESPDFESFEKINPRMVEPTGSPVAGAEYKVLDRSVKPGTLYYYFLVEIDVNGKMSTFGPVQARARIPVPEVFEMYSAIIQMDTFGV